MEEQFLKAKGGYPFGAVCADFEAVNTNGPHLKKTGSVTLLHLLGLFNTLLQELQREEFVFAKLTGVFRFSCLGLCS